jgi:asparagine synthase (glutamine-hydrolysing)
MTCNRKIDFIDRLLSNLDSNAKAYKTFKFAEPEPELFNKEFIKDLKEDTSIERILNNKYSNLNNLTLIELKKVLPENYLMVDDKINMYFSIESRVPFLDNRMIESSSMMPSRFKANNFSGKIILKKMMKGILPRKNIDRKKYGFTPPATQWFNNNLDSIKKQILSGKEIYRYIDKNYVKIMLERRSPDDINKLWSILTLNLWVRQYIEDEKIDYL